VVDVEYIRTQTNPPGAHTADKGSIVVRPSVTAASWRDCDIVGVSRSDPYETVDTVFGLLSVWLTVRKNMSWQILHVTRTP
jgi:hypothetical protein